MKRRIDEPLADEFIFKPTLVEARKVINEIGSRTKEEYLVDKGYIRIENTRRVVRDFDGYKRFCELEGLIDWQREKDQEMFFQANPEEREAYEARILLIKKDIRALINKMKVEV